MTCFLRSVAALLVVGSFFASAAVCQPPLGRAPAPDGRAAERELAEARDELEEIVGSELLRAEVPRLPVIEEVGLGEEDWPQVRRLLNLEPGEWSVEDRRWVEALDPLHLHLRSALAGKGEELGTARLPSVASALLGAAKVLALGDRLAILQGEHPVFVAGLALRLDLAERLFLQRGVIGPILGSSIQGDGLDEVRWAAVEEETSREVLERIDQLLSSWHLDVPDAAAVIAREGLLILERSAEGPKELAADDPTSASYLAPMAREFAALARACRGGGCAAGFETLSGRADPDDPHRAIADLLMPSFFDALAKLERRERLTGLALTAVALRIEALETGRYPRSLEELSPPAPVVGRAGLEYRPPAARDDGAQLRLTTERSLSDDPLPVWELPPVRDDWGLRQAAQAVAEALRARDFTRLAEWADREEGVLFAPYAFVDPDRHVTLSREDLRAVAAGERIERRWGHHDGSGRPIELSFREYVDRFVWDRDYLGDGEVAVDARQGRGNTRSNVEEVWPEARVVEYHVPGSDPRYGGMDWRSLRLVFERVDQEEESGWSLVGVVHDEWTI